MNLTRFTNWIGGVFVALGGTALARWPVHSPEIAVWTTTAGRVLALAGLAWIAIAVSRRVRRDSENP